MSGRPFVHGGPLAGARGDTGLWFACRRVICRRRMLPKISIVTPSYNQAQFVAWTARSVLLQRYPNLEYVWMDGGSKDDTVEVLKPYVDRFHHFVSERDKGQSDAIHRGFQKCSGEIM